MSLSSYELKSKRKSLIFRPIVAVIIGCFGFPNATAFAFDLEQEVIGTANAPVVKINEAKETKMSPSDLDERGIALRAALEKMYKSLGVLSGWENDITTSATPYVSAGMTFEDAERVLRAAGFDVDAHPGAQDINRPKDRYVVLASIRNFARRGLGSVTIYVTLYPEAPGDYSTVKGVEASLFVVDL